MKNIKTALVGVALTAPALVFAQSSTGPTAGSLTNLTPDASTILTAIGSIAVVVLGVVMAEKALPIVKRMFKF